VALTAAYRLAAAPAVIAMGLALLAGCALREKYSAETPVALPRAEVADFLVQGEFPTGRVDRREKQIALLDDRRGVLRFGAPGAWREYRQPALKSAIRVAWRRDDLMIASWKPELMRLEFLRVEADGPKGLGARAEALPHFSLPWPEPRDTNDHFRAPEDPIREARLTDRGTLLYHLDTGRQQGILVLDKSGRFTWAPFPVSLMTNQGHFIFQGFRLGWREELAYAVYVQTSRRGIEKTLLARLEMPGARIRAKTSFLCDPDFFLDVVDDAEAVFTRYDEKQKAWSFEYRNLDNAKARVSKSLSSGEPIPADLHFERKALSGILYDGPDIRFVSWR
jgi:hypothetical protein